MRFFLAAAIWIVFVGGLAFYMGHRDTAAAPEVTIASIEAVKSSCLLEITPTFTPREDPFALDYQAGPPAALVVRMGKNEILRAGEAVRAGQPLTVKDPPGLVKGMNEFYIEASPPLESSDRAFAVRLRLICGSETQAEETIWSEPGGLVAGVFRVDLTGSGPESGPGHD